MSTKLNTVPWSEKAEQSVIGGLLQDNGAAWRAEGLTSAHFYSAQHRAIWIAATGLLAAHHPADVITVFERLRAQGNAEECGGLVYLNQMAQCVPSAANVGRYAQIVIGHAQRRALIEACDTAADMARNTTGEAVDLLDKVATIFSALRQRGQQAEPQSLADLMMARTSHWEALEAGKVQAGIPTHLPTLDRAIGGLRGGALYVIGARPSVGKTSLAGQLALTCAEQGHRVLLLSQEMRAADLADRATANLGRVDLGALTTGRFQGDDWNRIVEAVERSAKLSLHIDDQPGLTLALINAKARRHKQQHGLAVLFVDYLQLCTGTERRDNRNTQIEEISRGLKTLAKDLDIAVVALSQLNRQSTQRDEPNLADLRDSGAVEQDADVVLMLHPRGPLPDGSMLVAGLLPKNRQGKCGRIALEFHGATQRWVESTADVSRAGSRGG